VNNDFHDNKTIFELLKGLEVKGLTTPATPLSKATNNGAIDPDPVSNGTAATAVAN
jgi:methylenetetrahydrofolate reductase (NADPH)